MISTNQLKNGNHIEVDGVIFKVMEFQHVKPGKGGAFVRTKLKRTTDGNVIDKTFRAGEKFRPVRTETRKLQYLYADGSEAHFMDTETYEQFGIAQATVADHVGRDLELLVVVVVHEDRRLAGVVEVLHLARLGAHRAELLPRPEGLVLDRPVVDLAQLGAHEGPALAGLDVLELDDLEDLAVDLDVRPVLELVG